MLTTTTITEIIRTGQRVSTPRHYRLDVTEDPDVFQIIAIEGISETVIGRKHWPVGAIGAQQGDVYFTRLAVVPLDMRRTVGTDGQLVPGSTQGSRHCVDHTHVRLWQGRNPTALQGPVIEADEAFTVTHPEHGHLSFPAGIYRVTYQRSFADEVRRVVD